MIELVANRKHQVIKRDGRVENYDENKMKKVLDWAISKALQEYFGDINEKTKTKMIDEVLKDTQVKVYDKIHISKLFDAVIETAANKISEIQPIWDKVAKNLLIQKYYKEVWNIKRNEYPNYLEVIKKGVQYKVYNEDIVNSFTENELKELGSYIKYERDFLFTFGGLYVFMDKYALKYSKNKWLELPQHVFMRVAIQLHYKDKNRLEKIKHRYDMMSKHQIATATPIMVNALKPEGFNPTSCVLIECDDDAESIMETARSMAIYSKNLSGLGVDVSRIRAIGSSIGKSGVSSGVVPFIKIFESVISGFNQLCYSEDTEILTENGWKHFYELKEEKVAQYVYDGDGKGHIEFVEYSDYYEYELNNEIMYHFYMNSGRYVDLLVSKYHRMVKLITSSNKLKIEYAKDIEYGSENALIVSGGNVNKNKSLSNWDRFLIAYQADGGRVKKVNGKMNGYYSYYFRFKKQKKVERLKSILDSLIKEGFDIVYNERINKNGKYGYVTILDVKVHVDYGILPKNFKEWVDISKYSEQEIDEFIEELKYWDGKYTHNIVEYTTINKDNIDVLQALASIANYRTNVYEVTFKNEKYSKKYSISFVKTNKIVSDSKGNKKNSNRGIRKKEVKYTGKIYCVTVPSGLIVVRRNNKVVISGNSKRPGSAAIYFTWWHYQSPEMIMLKDAGGKDEDRARRLKYAIKINETFLKKIENNEEIYLFDPKQTKELLDWDSDFEEKYNNFSDKNIKKRKIKARDLAFNWLKVYTETGNLYTFFEDNVNKFRVSKDSIRQGNLCCAEVMLPTKPLKLVETKLENKEIRELDGEIGICNLTSINCIAFDNMSEKEKDEFIYTLLLGMDNQIDLAYYPVKAGEKFNKLHRAIGIGITNYHNWLASNKIKLTDEKAKEKTHQLMESLYYYLVKNSVRLAKERSRYYYFDGSAWDRGEFVWEMYEKHFKEISREDLNYKMQYDWETLRKDMLQYGVRFEFISSIPPGASSSLVLGFTEGMSPIRQFKQNREGTFNIPMLAPNLQKNRQYYELAWDIDPYKLLDLAAIRQKFLDQSQSLDLFIKNPNSAVEIYKIIKYAHKLGIKSLYYLNSLKAGDIETCESCSV